MLGRKEIEEMLHRLKILDDIKVLEVDEEKLALCQTALELMDQLEEEDDSEDVS